MSVKKANILTITSVKGGTGKSTFTMNLAGMLSRNQIKTIILDLDLSSGVIGPSLNIKTNNDIYELTDDMANGRFESLDKYIKKYDENIDIISAPIDPRNALKVHQSYVENLIKQLEYKYDFILIDTNHTASPINLSLFDLSTMMIYLISDDLMDLKNMKSMISIYDDMNANNYKIVLNRSLRRWVGTGEIQTVLERDVDYILPESLFEKNIQKYVFDGKIITLEKHGKAFEIYNKIIKDIQNLNN